MQELINWWISNHNNMQLYNVAGQVGGQNGQLIYKMLRSREGQNFMKNLLGNMGIKNPPTDPYGMLSELGRFDKSKLIQFTNQTKYNVYDSANHFNGFDDTRHIAFTGATGSGKTTAFNLLICKGQIKVPATIFIFMSSMALNGDNSFYSKTAPFLSYQHQVQTNSNTPPKIYMFLDTEQALVNCLEAVRSSGSQDKKLLIIEDVRVAGQNTMKHVQSFLLGAKNAKCQVIFMDHVPSRDSINYESCGYVVMCSPSPQTFNIITQRTRSTKTPDTRYLNLSKLPKKAVIYDKEDEGIYWVFSNLPMIQAF